jgi:YhcH/YjgK/YiaL family protein
MNIKFLIFSVIIIMVSACNQPAPKNPEQWSEKEVNEWFDKGEWKEGWTALPDESINKREFAIRYFANPERWKKAFTFMGSQDLTALTIGRHELEGSDLFANVDEYITKNEEDARYEAHRKYADIQYLVSGEEQIGVVPLGTTAVTEPYVDEKDIVFLSSAENNYRQAVPGRFFVFFPEDAHRPCVKTAENSPVRKIVVKVRIN